MNGQHRGVRSLLVVVGVSRLEGAVRDQSPRRLLTLVVRPAWPGSVVHTRPFQAYHEVMRIGIEDAGVAAYAWTNANRGGSHTARSAITYMLYQVESGTQCPQTMTFAAFPSLKQHLTPAQAELGWLEKLTSRVSRYLCGHGEFEGLKDLTLG
jgi:alkylation response protein AidB-like acyl-CoA dehydrogenase